MSSPEWFLGTGVPVSFHAAVLLDDTASQAAPQTLFVMDGDCGPVGTEGLSLIAASQPDVVEAAFGIVIRFHIVLIPCRCHRRLCRPAGGEFAKHETVNYSIKEYAHGDVTTNSAEGFFGVFKRGMVGAYQRCGEQHFQRYPDEFTFRFNSRTALSVETISFARAYSCWAP